MEIMGGPVRTSDRFVFIVKAYRVEYLLIFLTLNIYKE